MKLEEKNQQKIFQSLSNPGASQNIAQKKL